MKQTRMRWLLWLLAAVIGGGGLVGCDEEVGWDHPNRERYAAPPPEKTDSKSIEELQREWRQRERLQDTQPDSPSEQMAAQQALQQAEEYLQQAFEAALGLFNLPQLPRDQQPAVGGGPPSQPEDSDQTEAGEM